jgi:uncharacterized membrane protein YcaP (DUF421 family)
MHNLPDVLRWALGLDAPSPHDYTLLQSCLRAALIYVGGTVILRVGEHRSLRRGGVFDVVLAFVLGSVLSRAINGTAALLPTLGVTVLLVAMHRLIAAAARRSERFSSLVKGDADLLVKEGRVREEVLRRCSLSRGDLQEGLRLHALTKVEEIDEAWLERNGDISAIPSRQPRVVEVDVEAGVQRIRIELS